MAIREGDFVIGGAGGDADGDFLKDAAGGHVDEGDGVDGDLVHEIAQAEGFLFVDLEGEAFVDAIGDERADGTEVVMGPGVLGDDEGAGDALDEFAFVEGGVVLLKLRDDGGALGVLHGGRAADDDGVLVEGDAFALGIDEEEDDDDDDGDADGGLADDEPDEELDEATVAATPATATVTAAAGEMSAAAGAGEEDRRRERDEERREREDDSEESRNAHVGYFNPQTSRSE